MILADKILANQSLKVWEYRMLFGKLDNIKTLTDSEIKSLSILQAMREIAWLSYVESERSYAVAVNRPPSNSKDLRIEFEEWWNKQVV